MCATALKKGVNQLDDDAGVHLRHLFVCVSDCAWREAADMQGVGEAEI